MTRRPITCRSIVGLLAASLFLWIAGLQARGDEPAKFYRGINLGGPALVIDGNSWAAGESAGESAGVVCEDATFEDQAVPLIPAADSARAQMIRSNRWSPNSKARVTISALPIGLYSVYLYVWEDNNSETFDIHLSGKLVAKNIQSGTAGHWQRLGPWEIEVSDGKLELAADGGIANLSGLEIWSGKLDAEDNPLSTPSLDAADGTSEAQVAVLLARNCLQCHNASDRKGGLDLTRRNETLRGGESGSALAPGDPEASLLLKRVAAGEMPPDGRTTFVPRELELLRAWISSGAKWAQDPIDPFLYTSDRRAGYNWWSLQPLRNIEPPPVLDSTRAINTVDHFILKRLDNAALSLAPEADRRTLIRRLSFDLTGLPPRPEEVAAFVADTDVQAYERLVDRLLDSPQFGERWARHWLDIVRYGESQGFERNKFRESAWKYRDFVIEAFNSDMAYDEFIRWQIAGDVLHPDNPLAVIASGFLALGPYDLTAYNNGTADMRAFAREEELEGLVATVAQTFMGLTVNCARCHDHKFDPITQKEFYQFSAALGGTYQGDERESLSESGRPLAQQQIEVLDRQMDDLGKKLNSTDEIARHNLSAQRARAESVVRLLHGGPVHTTVPSQPNPWHVLARGDFRQPGEMVVPRGIAAVSGIACEWQLADNAPEAERRKALAQWIADPKNPLTPRVIVNRLWGHHFGQGLVRTPSDFGFQGGQPSHPELLDWLACELVRPNVGPAWSLKRIHRLIVTSAVYRQSSRGEPKGMQVDADNRLLWRRTTRRLEAETFRDAVLAVSGELDSAMGGPGFRDFEVSSAGNNETYSVFDAVGGAFNRRTIYRTWVRIGTSPLLDMLDCPDPSLATPQRSVSSTPLQALSMLNSKFMEHYAQRLAERLEREKPNDVAGQVRLAITLAFSREATTEDEAFGRKFVAEHSLPQFCLVLLNANEFLYVD